MPPVQSATTIAGFPATVAAAPTGTGSPIVFLHGAFADHVAFDGWVDKAARAGHPAVAASRRGRLGVGPTDAEGLTIADYLADTRAVLDAVAADPGLAGDGEPPVLVGHSLGGLLAQCLAAEGRARAVVLLASAPPGMLTAQRAALPHFAPNVPRIMAGKPFAVPPGACSVLALNQVPEPDRPAIHAHLTEESGRVYRSLMLGTVRVPARRVRVPVYVVGGEDDRIVSPRLVRRTARHYGVAPRILPDHGHWLLEEPGWEELADDVLAWSAGPG